MTTTAKHVPYVHKLVVRYATKPYATFFSNTMWRWFSQISATCTTLLTHARSDFSIQCVFASPRKQVNYFFYKGTFMELELTALFLATRARNVPTQLANIQHCSIKFVFVCDLSFHNPNNCSFFFIKLQSTRKIQCSGKYKFHLCWPITLGQCELQALLGSTPLGFSISLSLLG